MKIRDVIKIIERTAGTGYTKEEATDSISTRRRRAESQLPGIRAMTWPQAHLTASSSRRG
jgi:hypothetical protein